MRTSRPLWSSPPAIATLGAGRARRTIAAGHGVVGPVRFRSMSAIQIIIVIASIGDAAKPAHDDAGADRHHVGA